MPSASGAIASRLPEPPAVLQKPALFLDLDGVLAPLAPTPDAVGPDARRTEVLRRLTDRLDGRVAIVSGRTLCEIDRIGDAATAPSPTGRRTRRCVGPWRHSTLSPPTGRA